MGGAIKDERNPLVDKSAPERGECAPFEAWLSYGYLSAEPKEPLVSALVHE
jgi:hypothetical protein